MTSRHRHGLSLLELLLALSITALVAAAIAGMLGAVSAGVGTRRDNRSVMVLSSAAEARLSSYIDPSRCILATDNASLTLWLNDSRQSGTVHATEIRWIQFDSGSDSLKVSYVHFPDNWTQTARDLEDHEYASNSNWATVLASYHSRGYISSRTLVDTVKTFAVATDRPTAMSSRHVDVELGFDTAVGVTPLRVSCTIRQPQTPTS